VSSQAAAWFPQEEWSSEVALFQPEESWSVEESSQQVVSSQAAALCPYQTNDEAHRRDDSSR
jgi:hypothetical protein